ncbi:flavin-containing amine oxidoreductase-domain containing protein [Cercophora newfieldiana]|uniref:Flavin-containing amine oxidoreductase-domain containing protein n=1 Tax=Cercophora newfieldiana TaxID=92897 RepID=A0AA39XWU0_9PEZI|nr:flavin-containing amine oxidoreductase-domain containing protein [Cercophora newfieldiana]
MAGRTLVLILAAQVVVAILPDALPVMLETKVEVTSRLSNIHISHSELAIGPLTITYGSCTSTSHHHAHHTVATVRPQPETDSRLVWILPEDVESGGCLSAWDNYGVLNGRSEPQNFRKQLRRRDPILMTEDRGIDVLGPWFDGVALLKDKEPSLVDVGGAKSKSVAIVGAGMSGLMTYLVLSQAGLTNISIIESTQRLGGRVRTEYLSGGPFDYSYQEMGPMRFPTTYTDPETNQTLNISDHQLVFSLAEEMNRLNAGKKNLSVDFIPWIQWNPNGLVYRGGFKLDTGFPPTVAEMAANASLNPHAPPVVLDADTQALQAAVAPFISNASFALDMVKNMFKAHKDWITNGLGGLGGDNWSEFAFMANYLNGTLNSTDMLSASAADSFWELLTAVTYFSASSFRTIDGGLNRLPLSFHPHVSNITTFNRKVERITLSPAAVHLHWRDTNTPSQHLQSFSYDYAIISAPFSSVRRWRLPPSLPTTLLNAINNLPYMTGCKVALEFRSRFWEHFPTPILGGCSTTTDIPGIGEICYPSYNLNSTPDQPASVLASWTAGDWGLRWVSVPEEEHVRYVLDTMVEIHGEVARETYTGKYRRKCWLLDEGGSGGWAHPSVGMHRLYMPEYFKTHGGLVFVGEHTSYTQAWVASALESGVRGGVQLLLELGLVDEAKMAVGKWMARWIDVVS